MMTMVGTRNLPCAGSLCGSLRTSHGCKEGMFRLALFGLVHFSVLVLTAARPLRSPPPPPVGLVIIIKRWKGVERFGVTQSETRPGDRKTIQI